MSNPRPRQESWESALPTNPEPDNTVGLEPGGGVQPGDTPPAASSEPEASEDRKRTPNQGPVSPGRKPQIIALTLIAILVLSVLGYGVANILAYVTK